MVISSLGAPYRGEGDIECIDERYLYSTGFSRGRGGLIGS